MTTSVKRVINVTSQSASRCVSTDDVTFLITKFTWPVVVMWCWKRMEISWPDRLIKKEVLHGSKEKRRILHAVKRRWANSIGHVLHRNCLQKHVIERQRKIEVTGRQGRRRKQLLKELKGKSVMEVERGSSRSHCVGNWLLKRLMDLL